MDARDYANTAAEAQIPWKGLKLHQLRTGNIPDDAAEAQIPWKGLKQHYLPRKGSLLEAAEAQIPWKGLKQQCAETSLIRSGRRRSADSLEGIETSPYSTR